MGIKTTNPHYNTFTFNGTDSSDYGVYVTDVNVFDAPKRVVDYIAIPGRSGDFALDQKSFENISVVYSCAMEQDSEADFEDAISEFKNLLASTKGYKRLEDDIHPNEYRMGVFSEGLEVETKNKKSATFDIEFNCKPQRYLTSGETAVSLTSGDTITNPTLFDASPLLQLWGYGDFAINGEAMEIVSTDIGTTLVGYGTNWIYAAGDTAKASEPLTIADANPGDTVSGENGYIARAICEIFPGNGVTGFSSASASTSALATCSVTTGNSLQIEIKFTESSIVDTIEGGNPTFTISATETSGNTGTFNITCNYGFETYIGNAQQVLADITVGALPNTWRLNALQLRMNYIYVYSTASALGSPIYFDLDVGEAYKIENNIAVSVNNAVSIPAELPTLVPGANTITFDNTITQFKIVPRWWKV